MQSLESLLKFLGQKDSINIDRECPACNGRGCKEVSFDVTVGPIVLYVLIRRWVAASTIDNRNRSFKKSSARVLLKLEETVASQRCVCRYYCVLCAVFLIVLLYYCIGTNLSQSSFTPAVVRRMATIQRLLGQPVVIFGEYSTTRMFQISANLKMETSTRNYFTQIIILSVLRQH